MGPDYEDVTFTEYTLGQEQLEAIEEEFSLLFHKGEAENIHFSKVHDEFLLITIFGKEVSLGLLRLKVAEAIDKIKLIWAR